MKDPGCDAEAMNTGGHTPFPAVDPGPGNVSGDGGGQCAHLESMTECAPCVARPLPLPQRVASIQVAIAAETEPLVTLTHLLQLCRDEHRVLQERMQDPGCRARAALIVAGVRSVLPATSTGLELGPEVRSALAASLTAGVDVPAVAVARLLAELLDERCGQSFRESFRRRSPY